tara:strand:+ start:366 stop:569 length:204 start_codon:yes stop_codon:yes gene_type:complete
MKFIKVKNTQGKDCIINLSNVSHFFSNSENETTICFTHYEDYERVAIPIEAVHQKLNAMNHLNSEEW